MDANRPDWTWLNHLHPPGEALHLYPTARSAERTRWARLLAQHLVIVERSVKTKSSSSLLPSPPASSPLDAELLSLFLPPVLLL